MSQQHPPPSSPDRTGSSSGPQQPIGPPTPKLASSQGPAIPFVDMSGSGTYYLSTEGQPVGAPTLLPDIIGIQDRYQQQPQLDSPSVPPMFMPNFDGSTSHGSLASNSFSGNVQLNLSGSQGSTSGPQIIGADSSASATSRPPRTISRKANLADRTHLFVSGFPPHFTEDNLKAFFPKYGLITNVRLLRDSHTGMPKGVGFVQCESEERALEIIRDMDGQIAPGMPEVRRLTIKLAEQGAEFPLEESNKLFIRHIPKTVTQEMVREVYSRFGTVVDVTLRPDTSSQGRREGTDSLMGYVTFSAIEEASEALKLTTLTMPFPCHTQMTLIVKPAESLETRNRRKQMDHSRTSTYGQHSTAGANQTHWIVPPPQHHHQHHSQQSPYQGTAIVRKQADVATPMYHQPPTQQGSMMPPQQSQFVLMQPQQQMSSQQMFSQPMQGHAPSHHQQQYQHYHHHHFQVLPPQQQQPVAMYGEAISHPPQVQHPPPQNPIVLVPAPNTMQHHQQQHYYYGQQNAPALPNLGLPNQQPQHQQHMQGQQHQQSYFARPSQ